MTFDEPLHTTFISPEQSAGLQRQAETARLGDAIAELASPPVPIICETTSLVRLV